MYFKIFLLIIFTILIASIIYGIMKDLKTSEKYYKEQKLFFIRFSTKVPFFLSLYFIAIGKLSYDLPEIFNYGDEIYHFIFNDITFSISASIIATFLFLFASLINDLKKESSDITMTRLYLDFILKDLLKNQNLEDKYFENINNEREFNYKKILHDVKNNYLNINYKIIENIDITDISIKKIQWIHWIETNPLKYWFSIILVNAKKESNTQYGNPRGVLRGALECIAEIDNILEKPIRYIYNKLM